MAGLLNKGNLVIIISALIFTLNSCSSGKKVIIITKNSKSYESFYTPGVEVADGSYEPEKEKPARPKRIKKEKVRKNKIAEKRVVKSKKKYKKKSKRKLKRRKTYRVKNKKYKILTKVDKSFKQRGIASWYGKRFHGRRTASGKIYNMYGVSAAHKSLPLGTKVKVKNLKNRKSVILTINDRGPFYGNRIIDLSLGAAKRLGFVKSGLAVVEVTIVK